MTERERLSELINKARDEYPTVPLVNGCKPTFTEFLTEQLLANGVIVLPVKVGQTVYVVNRYYGGVWRIHECRVDNLTIYEKHIFMCLVDGKYNFGIEKFEIGKTVFLTKEEAEIELERIENERN